MNGDGIAVSLRGLTKHYPGAAEPAVRNLTLDIAAGEIVALVGPSGCGKTTTLKMINRLIEPTGGTIDVLGRDQRSLPAHELRRTIGYVIQQIGLFPHRTVAGNIGVVPDLLGWDRHRTAARVDELLELVGLPADVAGRYPAELSGGQQQRVGVARALAADPPLLLMDEPYSAVDPLVRERLQDELLALQAKVGKTIVIVTHDIDEALKLGDRVAVLAEGGVLAQYATPDELLRDPADGFVAAFLGRERGLRRLGLRRAADLTTAAVLELDAGVSVEAARGRATAAGVPWVLVRQGPQPVGGDTVSDGVVGDGVGGGGTGGDGVGGGGAVGSGSLAGVGLVAVAALDGLPAGATLADAVATVGDRDVPVIGPEAPLREALDAVLRSGAAAAVVAGPAAAGPASERPGVVTLDLLAEALR